MGLPRSDLNNYTVGQLLDAAIALINRGEVRRVRDWKEIDEKIARLQREAISAKKIDGIPIQ